MALCPFAIHQLIPETWQQGRITPTTVILHRAVSSADSLQNYWNSPGVEVESHFYVGQHGDIYQFVDTGVRADANVQANGIAVSIETWDGGNTPDSMPWNDKQVAALKRLVAWVCDTHGIDKRAATSPFGGGIGGHNWFAKEWANGPRGCPGTARNNQIRNDIIPAVQRGEWESDDMDPLDVWTQDLALVDPNTEELVFRGEEGRAHVQLAKAKWYSEKGLWVGLRNEEALKRLVELMAQQAGYTAEQIAAVMAPMIVVGLRDGEHFDFIGDDELDEIKAAVNDEHDRRAAARAAAPVAPEEG